MAKQIYLTNVTVEEAWERWRAVLPTKWALPLEQLTVHAALHRFLAEPVFARRSVPHYLAAAMDGVAVMASQTTSADLQTPLSLGEGQEFVWVDTGDPLPIGFDAVIMVEEVHSLSDGSIEIVQPAVAWQHVRGIGEDIVQSELLLPRYQRLRPHDLAALASAGCSRVNVFRQPRVVIIPTGDELVPVGVDPTAGQIIESNSLLFAGMVSEWGALPIVQPIVPDDWSALTVAVTRAAEQADILILNAGSSHGRDDYAVDLCRSLGEVAVHGVAIRPGKPVILGTISGKPVVGVPGYPVSGALVMELFVRPLIAEMLCQNVTRDQELSCRLTRRVVSSVGNREFIRVQVGKVGDNWVATPLGRGAGALTSLVKADGFLVVPERSEGFGEGSSVSVALRQDQQELSHKVVCIGSHDISLDLLGDCVRRQFPDFCLTSSHVGSLAGLMALRRGEAHLAGTHLFDEATEEYNIPYLQRLFPQGGITLINLVLRQQGLICRLELADKIRSLSDVVDLGLCFVNRQRGAGTRVLTDHLLKTGGLQPSLLIGYDREETSHLNVAASIAGGAADVGMGILAAAKAFDLAFVPLVLERYDLAILTEFLEHPGVIRLLRAIKSADFQQQLAKLGGYEQSLSGRVFWGDAPYA